MTTRWVLGGERLPPKFVLTFGVMWTLIAAGWIWLAFDGEVGSWKGWLQLGTSALYVLFAVYYWALYVHLRRTKERV
ncbi:hypothetical protein ACIOD2_25120 [Amycolatopsis sp. NPDC088138]|uniref:hypothetical protein n=1 Tax=Amycolatopsis sp. NPDC088138 TaxID=3363938 RepID=UPI00381E0350